MTKEFAQSMSNWNLQCEINYRIAVKREGSYKTWTRSEKIAWTRSINMMASVLADRLMEAYFAAKKEVA